MRREWKWFCPYGKVRIRPYGKESYEGEYSRADQQGTDDHSEGRAGLSRPPPGGPHRVRADGGQDRVAQTRNESRDRPQRLPAEAAEAGVGRGDERRRPQARGAVNR